MNKGIILQLMYANSRLVEMFSQESYRIVFVSNFQYHTFVLSHSVIRYHLLEYHLVVDCLI